MPKSPSLQPRPLLTHDSAFHEIRARQLIAPALPWKPPPPQLVDPALPLYLPVPRTYGSRRATASLVVQPVTDKGVTTVVKTFGPGPLQVSDLWLGDRAIAVGRLKAGLNRNYAAPDGTSFSYELLEGRQTDGGLDLFPGGTALDDQEFSTPIPYYTALTSWSKMSATRLSAAGTTRIKGKIAFPNGLSKNNKDTNYRWKGVTARLQVAFRPSGNGAAVGKSPGGIWSMQVKGPDSPDEVDYLFEFNLPDTKAWEVGLAIDYFDDGRKQSDAVWTRLESKSKTKAGVLLGYSAIAIQGDASLFGNDPYLTGLTAQCAAELKETVGGSAVLTRSPSAAFLDVLEGVENPRAVADARIHSASVAAWNTDCANRGYTFDFTFGENGSAGNLFDALKTVCAAGRASFALIDGKYGVVMEPTSVSPTLYFCPRTLWGFRPVRSFALQPHAVRVTYERAIPVYYTNKGGSTVTAYQYRRDTVIVYNAGYTAANASLFESWQLDGVTTQAQAEGLVYYHLATLAQRIRTYEFYTDAAHLRATRGDTALGAHDVPGWGTSWGRVKAVLSSTRVQLDERVVMAVGGAYEVTAVRPDGTYAVLTVTTAAGETDTITTTSPHGAAVGDLCFFGTAGASTKTCVVLKVEPGPDLSARVTVAELGSGLDSATADSTKAAVTTASLLSSPAVQSVGTAGAVSISIDAGATFA